MPVSNSAFDLAIIGGGPAGYVAAIKAAQSGLKTALIEKEKVGGTCLHKGCIPTKTLLYSAELYRKFANAGEYGITTGSLNVDYPLIHRRKEYVVKRLFQGVQSLLKKNGVDVFSAEGRIISNQEVSIVSDGIETNRIKVKNIILATGSAPFIPKNIPYDKKYVLTSDDILLREEIPKSIIIVGGGAVGIEFACLFNAFGTEVTVLELLEDILPSEDKEINGTVKNLLIRRGVNVLTQTSLEKVEIENGVKLEIKGVNDISGNREFLHADLLLLAAGRVPLLDNIGIEEMSLNFDGQYLRTNEGMETSQRGVYAIGDITGAPLLAHKAINEGILSVTHLTGKDMHIINRKNIPRVVYSFPQVASIGLTQKEAEEMGYKVKIGKFPFAANSMAIIEGESLDGFVKIVSEEKYGEILGVHAIGHHVGEWMWGLSLNSILEGTVQEVSNAIFPHPTLSEALFEAAHSIVDKPIRNAVE
ncbi:MAG: dihydrolipoyl dehydrogenase [Candidatus Kuenenia stuttgartiensis]|nr:MAG: dihydrolipoyl dehydrogenase [Candidatus Kuenenia stuttgartiensis]